MTIATHAGKTQTMTATTKPAPVLTHLAGVESTGNLSIVTPGPIDAQALTIIALIDAAVGVHKAGNTAIAAKLIMDVENRLKVTAEDRWEAMRPRDELDRELDRFLRSLGPKGEGEPESAEPLILPEDPGRLTADEIKALNKADREQRRARTQQSKQIAIDKIMKIHGKARQRVIVRERSDGIKETIDLARARGEGVDTAPKQGAANMSDRDGLLNVVRGGYLTPEQQAIALEYRKGFEQLEIGLQAQTMGEVSGAGHDHEKFVAKAFERAKATTFAAACHREVRLRCISHLSAVQMLQRVAGAGDSLRTYGSGRALERNRAALIAALDVAIQVHRELRRKAAEEALARGAG